MQRGVVTPVIFFIVALVLGVAIGVLYFFQTKSLAPTIANNIPLVSQSASPGLPKNPIVTYKNQAGFQFDYQTEGYRVKEDNEKELFVRQNGDFRTNFTNRQGYPPAEVLAAVVLVSKQDENPDRALFTIWVFQNSETLDSEKWFAKYLYYPFIWGLYDSSNRNQITPKNEATVSGQLAKFGTVSYQQNSPKFYLVPRNNKMFLLKVLQDRDKIGEQTLSSLKLI